MLTLGQTPSILVVSKVPTIILGMGALFGFPEQSDVPSIAAMVNSRRWPLIFSYGASGPLLDFYTSSEKRKPDQIIIFKERQGSPDNVLHGIVIDNKVCHPKNNASYLGTHAGMIGITRQTHYYVLLDQAGFLADELQEFLYSWGQFMKIRDASETSSSHGGMYAPGVISVPQLSRLKDKVSNFILVC
ncbi:hypothetical protein GOBAR_AA11781 [Gossypium barbadense]|uniref:Piwi domain-containing protein n=1 Tax=Gossypium barbadense TaxID=3634 RepID=A0A2P5XZY4_GOSBA|nr:hypothetical protein GOBAR_AA11781 [Gossypium barbadense]